MLLHYNAGWVAEVRSGSKTVKILPRILFEGWSVNDYMSLFASERMMQEVAEFITQSVDVSDNGPQVPPIHSLTFVCTSLGAQVQWYSFGDLESTWRAPQEVYTM